MAENRKHVFTAIFIFFLPPSPFTPYLYGMVLHEQNVMYVLFFSNLRTMYVCIHVRNNSIHKYSTVRLCVETEVKNEV